MAVKADQLKGACEKKLNIRFRSGKELNGWVLIDKMRVCRVTVSKGNGDLPPKTHRRIASSLFLSDSQLTNFVKCTVSGSDVISIIRQHLEGLER